MKKRLFDKRAKRVLLLHILLLGTLGLCFLKFTEEIGAVKEQIRSVIDKERRDTKIDFSSYPAIEHTEGAWYESVPLIYHAGGDVGGLDYTNSIEAMEETLAEGQRFVEIDFLYTSDGELACAHYWESLWEEEQKIPNLEEFKKLKIFGKYTSMNAYQLVDYMKQYPDLRIIIDTKEENYEAVIRDLVEISSFDTDITERFIIQLYEAGSKEVFQKIYPFKDENFLFTAYKLGANYSNRIMNICYEENIAVVAVPADSWEQETIDMFREKDFIIYEYTVNRPNRANESIAMGIQGFYTDCMVETDLKR